MGYLISDLRELRALEHQNLERNRLRRGRQLKTLSKFSIGVIRYS